MRRTVRKEGRMREREKPDRNWKGGVDPLTFWPVWCSFRLGPDLLQFRRARLTCAVLVFPVYYIEQVCMQFKKV